MPLLNSNPVGVRSLPTRRTSAPSIRNSGQEVVTRPTFLWCWEPVSSLPLETAGGTRALTRLAL